MASGVANTTIRVTDQASPALRNINIALTANLAGFERLERALAANTAALNRTIGASGTYIHSQQQAAAATRQHASASDGLISKLKGVAAAYLGVQTAQKFMTETDAFINTQARLNVMNDGLQTTDELYHKLYSSAQRSLAPLNDVANNVSKLGIVAGESFKNNDEIIAFVETFNKAATVSGASNSEKSNAMYQLSQAFASGRLQGDELRSVRENAPMLYKSIQKELERTFGEGVDFKKLAADGLITPDVIKRAAFASAGEIDKAFNSMPMSFSDTMIQAFNKVKIAMTPIFKDMQGIINSADFKNAINTVTNYAIIGINAIWNGVQMLGNGIRWAIGVFNIFKPVITALGVAFAGAAAGLAVYWLWQKRTVAMAALQTAWAAITLTWESLKTIGLWATAAAWNGVAVAQLSAMALAVGIGILVVGAIYLIIKHLDLVVGGLYWIWEVVKNVGQFFVNVWHNAGIDLLLIWNNLQIGWNNFMIGILKIALTVTERIGTAFQNVINPVIGAINRAIQAAAQLPGLGKLANMQIKEFNAAALADNQKTAIAGLEAKNKALLAEMGAAESDRRSMTAGFGDLGAAFDRGKAKGAAGQEWMSGKVSDLKGALGGILPDTAPIDASLGNVGTKGDNPLLGEIAKNTGDTAKNTAKNAEDDYKLISEVMSQRALNRIGNGGGTVKVEMTNNNNLSSNLDIKGFLAALANTMEEAASTAAQGLHN